MVKITRIEEPATGTRLLVEGRVTGRAVHELRAACAASLGGPSIPGLDLSGVSFIDPAGVAALREALGRGMALVRCSAFVQQLLSRDGATASTDDEERDLLARLRAGEAGAFETLVRRYGGRMLAVAARLLRSDADARDAVQEAFLAAFKAIGGFAGDARLSTWLHRIVVNSALMKLRTRRRRAEESVDDLLPRFDEQGGWVEPVGGRWESPSDVLLERRETRALVRRGIDRLPDTYRTVLLLRDVEELETDEAAAALGITPSAVKTRLHRARQALRTVLAAELRAADARAGAV